MANTSSILEPVDLVNIGEFRAAARLYLSLFRDTHDYSNLTNAANCLYKLGKFRYAAAIANKALALSSGTSDQALLLLANIAYEKGDFKDASRLYSGLRKSALAHHAHHGLARICMKRGKQQRALHILELLTSRCPNDHSPHLFLAQLYLELGNYALSWKSFREVLEINSNIAEAWDGAYQCSYALKEFEIARVIATKLVALNSSRVCFYEYLGRACYQLEDAKECAAAFASAYRLSPKNLVYYLNSQNPCSRISASGITSYKLAQNIRKSCKYINAIIDTSSSWIADGSCPLAPFAYYTAYSPFNLKYIYGIYYKTLGRVYRSMLDQALSESQSILSRFPCSSDMTQLLSSPASSRSKNGLTKKIRLGFLSRYFYSHSNVQAFAGMLHYLDRSRFEIFIIHRHLTVIDANHLDINHLADQVVYLSESLAYSHALLVSLELDILFFTDIGMDPFDFLIPDMRACSIQITGWGLPHTSGLESIDYYISSALLETSNHQDEYTERLVLLDGLPCCFMANKLFYRNRGRDYFLLPNDRKIIGCVQNLPKIHPDFDCIINQIAQKIPEAIFVFVSTDSDSVNQRFLERLASRAPFAYRQMMFLSRCDTNDFLSLCDCIDVLLDTPYYGAGVTAYMSAYVGTPMVAFRGNRLRDSTTAGIYNYLEINNAPIVDSVGDYIEKVVELLGNFDLRLQIKRDTVDAAHRLYDNHEYIRSFENFCESLVASG